MHTADTPTLVFSYRRFSSGRQASGHSLERQTESARRWCLEKGFRLDENLALSDLGISAYSGDNASRGALAGFLKAAELGHIPIGSILLVESLDRLSRAAIPDAMSLLTAIVKTGVRVVSLIDGHEWNKVTIQDTMSFMLSVLLFSRAHNESSTKARRVSEQFQKKRSDCLPVVSFGHGPGWAFPRPDRSGWDVDSTKVEIVEKVFRLAASGLGGIAIARKANEERWTLPWRERKNTSTRWEHTGVSRILRDRRVLGEWQPKRMVLGKLTIDGDPVLNYFPKIISDELWFSVQAALGGRIGPLRIRGVIADVFSGLFYCSCGERMDRKSPAGRGYARYYCLGRKNGASSCPGLAESVLLDCLLAGIAQIEQSAFNPSSAAEIARTELVALRAKSKELDERAKRVLDSLEESGHSPLILKRLKTIEDEQAATKASLTQTQVALEATPMLDHSFGKRFAEDVKVIVADAGNPTARQKLAQSLRQVVKKIEWNGSLFTVKTRSNATIFINPPVKALGRIKNRNAGRPRGIAAA